MMLRRGSRYFSRLVGFRWCVVIAFGGMIAFGGEAVAKEEDKTSDSATQSEILFTRYVSDLLAEKCFACHGADPEAIEGSLDLGSIEATLNGGDSGEAALVPGGPDASPIFLAAMRNHDEWSAMPPKEAEALSDQELEWLRQWIASGSEWPTPE